VIRIPVLTTSRQALLVLDVASGWPVTWRQEEHSLVIESAAQVHRFNWHSQARDDPEGVAPGVDFEEQVMLGEEEFVVVLPTGDVRADLSSVDLYDLRNRLWVLFAADHGLSDVVRQACRSTGPGPRGGTPLRPKRAQRAYGHSVLPGKHTH
jgi:hypothetical protein